MSVNACLNHLPETEVSDVCNERDIGFPLGSTGAMPLLIRWSLGSQGDLLLPQNWACHKARQRNPSIGLNALHAL
jgi:hypothetical protein